MKKHLLKPSFLIGLICLIISQHMDAQVNVVGDQKIRFEIKGNTLKIPAYTNYPIEANDKISSAVIVIHGAERNAEDYYLNMTVAADMRKDHADSTIIIAPQFLTEQDIDAHSLDSEHLYWSSGGWSAGSNSKDNDSNPRPARVSSYAILDSIVLRLIATFDLKHITITGHSAGGQVTQRYAAASPLDQEICDQYGIAMKYIVANPSSYVYMDKKRVVRGTNDRFETPNTSCSDYNEWKYGLDKMYSYPKKTGEENIRANYPKRNVVYLLGAEDNDPSHSSLDESCEALIQGRHRRERGEIYYNYIKDHYGDEVAQRHQLAIVPKTGHSNSEMYTSDVGLSHLFEIAPISSCTELTVSTRETILRDDISVTPNPTSGQLTISGSKISNTIQIYSMSGRLLREVRNEQKINISALDSGLYLVKVSDGDGYTIKKVVMY